MNPSLWKPTHCSVTSSTCRPLLTFDPHPWYTKFIRNYICAAVLWWFSFFPPRCVPTCVVFLNFPHNASHLPTSFLYEETHPSQTGCVFFCIQTLQPHSILPEDPGPRSMKSLYIHVSAYIMSSSSDYPNTPNPHARPHLILKIYKYVIANNTCPCYTKSNQLNRKD